MQENTPELMGCVKNKEWRQKWQQETLLNKTEKQLKEQKVYTENLRKYAESLVESVEVFKLPQDEKEQAQQAVNKVTPLIFSGMFLFFPLPAGVLMYMTIANAFQTAQTFILTKEPLPENLQKMVDEQERAEKGRDSLPFERKKGGKRKEKASG